MKNNSFLIENFEDILLQKSFEDLYEIEKGQLIEEKITEEEYISMRAMFIQMKEIDELEEIPKDSIKKRLMIEFEAKKVNMSKNKIIQINRWFYLGIAATIAIVFVLFYNISEKITYNKEFHVAQKLEKSDYLTIPNNQKENADRKSPKSSLSINQNLSVVDKIQPSEATENFEQPEIQTKDSEKDKQVNYLQNAPINDASTLSEEIKQEIENVALSPAIIDKQQQTVSLSLAEISELQYITVEIY
jgi:hypothetical protein